LDDGFRIRGYVKTKNYFHKRSRINGIFEQEKVPVSPPRETFWEVSL